MTVHACPFSMPRTQPKPQITDSPTQQLQLFPLPVLALHRQGLCQDSRLEGRMQPEVGFAEVARSRVCK